MKKPLKKLLCLVFCALLIAALPLSARGVGAGEEYLIEKENMSFTFPENVIVLSNDTPINSPDWADAGITDPAEYYQRYDDLGAAAHFVSPGGRYNVYLAKKDSLAVSSIYNLTLANDEILAAVLDDYAKINMNDGFDSAAEFVMIGDYRFVQDRIHFQNETTTMDEMSYMTVMNGLSYTFSTHVYGALEQGDLDFLKMVVTALRFTKITEPPETDTSVGALLRGLLPLILALAVLITLIIYLKVRSSRQKRRKKQIADGLSEFRANRKKLEEAGELTESETLFLNKTVHGDDALRKFAVFHAYRKNPATIPIYLISIALSVVIIVSLISRATDYWFGLLLFAVIALFSIYRLLTTSKKITRELLRSYQKYPNRVAIFSFRDDSFRLSGLQANGIYPYLQVTEGYETKEFFYLYFGEDHAYLVNKAGFALGSASDFSGFLKEKLGRHYHRR